METIDNLIINSTEHIRKKSKKRSDESVMIDINCSKDKHIKNTM